MANRILSISSLTKTLDLIAKGIVNESLLALVLPSIKKYQQELESFIGAESYEDRFTSSRPPLAVNIKYRESSNFLLGRDEAKKLGLSGYNTESNYFNFCEDNLQYLYELCSLSYREQGGYNHIIFEQGTQELKYAEALFNVEGSIYITGRSGGWLCLKYASTEFYCYYEEVEYVVHRLENRDWDELDLINISERLAYAFNVCGLIKEAFAWFEGYIRGLIDNVSFLDYLQHLKEFEEEFQTEKVA